MTEDIKPEESSIPPRVTIKLSSQSGQMQEAPTAVTMPSLKKKTARISLDQVTAEPGATPAASVSGVGVAAKSIRLAPAVSGQANISPMPPVGKALGGVLSEEAKRATSRIPLETILAEQGGNLPEGAPKTIKVKRPVLSATPKVAGLAVAPAPEPVTPAAGEMASKSQTARVDIAPEQAEPQPTQKKTIKIRRPDGAGGESAPAAVRSVSIARAEGATAGVAAAGSEVPSPHWFFVVSAAAAMMTICFMLYVLAAQAYPDLGWKVGG